MATQQHPSSNPQDNRQDEIWSSRVQKELLALTTDDGDNASQTKAMLPSFVTIQQHKLDIGSAICAVNFQVRIIMADGSVKTALLQIDVSFPRNADGKLEQTMSVYPYTEPNILLLEGEEYFAIGSTIRNGDRIIMDIEWTPSLRLADAIVNIGLKIKECFLQDEPYHAASSKEMDPVEEIEKGARRLASSAGKMASSIAKAVTLLGSPGTREPVNQTRKKHTRKNMHGTDIRIGQDINLLDEPWVDAHGVYACKAIRRPPFVQEAMDLVESMSEPQSYSSPTAMFKSMTKSVLQESFLMITETHIIEMKSSKLNTTTATVTFCISIDLLHKLKFRRGESVSLFFKPDPDGPMIYMCPDSSDAVHQIQSVLQRHGVKGKHTNAAAHKAIQDAMHLVQEIQTKELALKHDPSVERVNEIMDLYRQAAERFEVAGDIRHEEVIAHLRKFLALPLTASILDGSFKQPVKVHRDKGVVPQGEILERFPYHLDDDDDFLSPIGKIPSMTVNDKAFEENIDNILKEAEADMQQFKGSVTADKDDIFLTSDRDGALAGLAADMESLLKAADAELQELMQA